WHDAEFRDEYARLLRDYAGRPTPMTECPTLSAQLGIRVVLKREDLTHTGSHKINNVLGQALLARRMGKTRLIAETGAGQHGVATATAAALFGLSCTVFMGAVDVQRQALNVWRMRLLGAKVVPVTSGSATLKDAINDAMREWVASVGTTHYCIGSVMGPHPFPWMVREFQRVIGDEARAQLLERDGRDPDAVVACVGGGSNAMGTFAGFLESSARCIGVEAGGHGIESGQHGAAVERGTPGVIHGMRTLFLQDEDGQLREAHSISAGLDYPGVGPEHAALYTAQRTEYFAATDEDALTGFRVLAQTEGIVPALEPAHAIGWLVRAAGHEIPLGHTVLVTMSGRGDKDAAQVAEMLGEL
ncbi:MAG: tryptophan synthase subunit beta, partial [Acidimicrobiia bacterium]